MKRFLLFLSGLTIAIYASGQSDTTATRDSIFYSLQASEVVSSRSAGNSSSRQTTLGEAEVRKQSSYGFDIPAILANQVSLVATSENGSGLGGTAISIRGTDATRINVTVNGMPMNDPDSHAMYWYDSPDLASAAGSIQIVRGAGTTSNGTGAFGGAISLSTVALKREFGASVSASYGSFNTSRQAVKVGTGSLGGHWIADLQLSHASSSGYVDRGSTDMLSYLVQAGWYDDRTIIKLLSFGGKTKTYLSYTGATAEEMRLYGRTYHTSGQYKTSDGPYVLADGTHVAYFDDQTDNYTQINNQLIIDRTFSAAFTLNASLFYTYGNGYYRQYKDDAWLCSYDNLTADWSRADLIRRKNMVNHRFGANVTGLLSLEGLQLSFGGSYLNYRCPHYGTLDWVDGMKAEAFSDFIWYDNNVVKNDGNVFAKADWTPLEWLSLYGGLQWRLVGYKAWGSNDNYDWNAGAMQAIAVDKFWSFLNPSVGVKFTLARRHLLEASFSIANKEPTRSDFTDRYMFSSLSDEPLPETLYDWELAYKYEGKVVSAGVNFYYMYYRNQLVPSGIVNDSSDNININVDRSFRRGAEISFGLRPLKWMSLDVFGTFSQNRIKDFVETIDGKDFFVGDCDIAYSPAVIAKADLKFIVAGFEGSVIPRYVGKQYFTNGDHEDLSLPGYFTTDLDLSYSLKPRKTVSEIRFGVRVSNIFNAQYCSFAYGGSYMAGGERQSWSYWFPQPGINAIGCVSISF